MDLQFGHYRLSRRERKILGPDGPVEIGDRAFDLLEALLENSGRTVSKNDLLDRAWPGVAVEENTLQVHISTLRKALGPSQIVTVHGRGYKYAGADPVAVDLSPQAPHQPITDRKPVIAVWPFDNLSGDPDQQFFTDGMTDDIIDRLSRYRLLSVIGQATAFALRDRGASAGAVRDHISADYLVTGNVRRSASHIRIAVRLTDLRTGNALWAERYDRPLEDVFTVQDEVASNIASMLFSRVQMSAGERRPRGGPSSMTSYELTLLGAWHFKKLTRDSYRSAAEVLERAIAHNPDNADAYRGLAVCENNRWLFDFEWAGLERSLAFSQKAVELDPVNAVCHAAQGFCLLWLEGTEAARKCYAKALALNPGDPYVLIESALLNVYGGDLSACRDFARQARALDPLPPPWYDEFEGIADFVEGQYHRALAAFRAVPEGAWDTMYALSCAGLIGDRAIIESVLDRARAEGPHWDYLGAAKREPFVHAEPRERLIEGLHKALTS